MLSILIVKASKNAQQHPSSTAKPVCRATAYNQLHRALLTASLPQHAAEHQARCDIACCRGSYLSSFSMSPSMEEGPEVGK
jgi:hypothetical protein